MLCHSKISSFSLSLSFSFSIKAGVKVSVTTLNARQGESLERGRSPSMPHTDRGEGHHHGTIG
jgi:hypothetical protein